MTCADELNIVDIEDNICYFADGYISMYIRVIPIAFEYLSLEEKKQIIEGFKNEFAGEQEVIKIITMSLPVSTKEISSFLCQKRNNTNNAFRRTKLISQINEIDKLTSNEELVEKQIIIQLFKKYDNNAVKDLNKRAREYVLKFKNIGIESYILDNKGILQLFNSFLNMKFKKENLNSAWGDDFE